MNIEKDRHVRDKAQKLEHNSPRYSNDSHPIIVNCYINHHKRSPNHIFIHL